MKKPKYIAYPFTYLVLIILPIISSIIVLLYKEYAGAIVCFCMGVLFAIPYIIFRKKFFAKMIIDDEGFKIYYRKQIVRELKWKDIKDAQAIPTSYGGHIFFANKPLYTGKESWKNTYEIFVRCNSNFIVELYKHKDKIPVPIRDLEKLHKEIVKRLT